MHFSFFTNIISVFGNWLADNFVESFIVFV